MLGAIFLNEVVDFRLLLGAALIIGGIGVVDLRLSDLRKNVRVIQRKKWKMLFRNDEALFSVATDVRKHRFVQHDAGVRLASRIYAKGRNGGYTIRALGRRGCL